MAKNAIVGQSGGPTSVINSSLAGVYESCKRRGAGKVYGMMHGVAGLLERKVCVLDDKLTSTLDIELLKRTPSSYLGSCRYKLPDWHTAEGEAVYEKLFEILKDLDIGYFFYIGGNDSADAARIVAEEAEKEGYPLVVYHIPKTIDNDLRSCDHTPGFGSAARFVASAIRGDDLDNRALEGVKIDIIMGRDAGFLTAASALARVRPDDGPHLIYLPEVPFSEEKFVKDVKAAVKKFGRCVCAVSEGIRGKDGVAIGAKLGSGEKDSHGNVQMSGSGALGDALAKILKTKAGVKRVRADTFGYLQRSFPGIASKVDQAEARAAGAAAVKAALKGELSKGTIAIVREEAKKYKVAFAPVPIANAAKYTRSVPKEYIAKNGHDVTEAFLAYARPIVGELPPCEVL